MAYKGYNSISDVTFDAHPLLSVPLSPSNDPCQSDNPESSTCPHQLYFLSAKYLLTLSNICVTA